MGEGFCPVCILTWHWECLGQCTDVHTLINTCAPIVCEAWMAHCTRYRLLTDRCWDDVEFTFSMSTRVQTAVSYFVFLLLAVCLSRNVQRSCLTLGFGWWERGIRRDGHQDRCSQCFLTLRQDSMLCRMTFKANLKLNPNCRFSNSCGWLEKKTVDFWVSMSHKGHVKDSATDVIFTF